MSASHIADSSTHLWRLDLPSDLPEGAHIMHVTAIDQHGREFTDEILFEVRAERPLARWNNTLWEKPSN